MPYPLVEQLRFVRSEFRRALAGLSDEDARRRLLPMNCISQLLGHTGLPDFVGDIDGEAPYRPEQG
jgi:hypothetical protein